MHVIHSVLSFELENSIVYPFDRDRASSIIDIVSFNTIISHCSCISDVKNKVITHKVI